MVTEGARCPVGGERIDEHAARINGGLVMGAPVVAIVVPAPWILGLLAVDFAIKVFAGFAHSPVCKLAGRAATALGIERRMMDSAPKRFAAIIGLVMCVLGLAVGYLAPIGVFYGVTGVFLVFATLEAVAGFCMGCFLFGLLPERLARVFVRA